MVNPDYAPLIGFCVPTLAAALIALTGAKRPNLREFWSVAAGVALCAVVAGMIGPVRAGNGPECTLFPILPGLELAFRVDAFGLLFAGGAAVLWIVASLYSIGYMRTLAEHAQTRYFACFALAIAATMGVAFSANLFTLFLFYEGLTFVTYPLVGHKETAEARAGARKYVVYLLGAAKLGVLGALILTWNLAGTLDFQTGGVFASSGVDLDPKVLTLIFVLFLFGFAKNALMPLHGWLPAAMVAPTPVSALLHAVAVVKTGVFSTLRVFLFVFGAGTMREVGGDQIAMVAAMVTILVASLLALAQDNLKARLAYSTVSQLSYIVLGAALLNASGVLGGVAHITNHAVSKITLFLCAGSIYASTHKTEISQLSGLGRRMPWTMGAFALASLSIIGIPPTCGFVTKWNIAIGSVGAENYAVLAVLLTSSLLSAAYLGPIVYKAFFESEPEGGEEVREVGWMVVPLVCCAVASLVLGIWPDPVVDLAGKVMP
ncbi:MAG: monovalent cation/H+ antiporter subunit D family protein [Planctomycetota bacterium]|jgi:multicomponent Na+:H+ antiporter subunit D|nr:monovalent cation/H+ antiporter subunit D family protein [Planctomycetota bacterium]MDP6988073.1 monovalent cation/H+ antiporter subunit D family protein [Planctomycetota bacterium]